MTISVIVNTACLGEKAKDVRSKHSGLQHGMRAAMLRDVLLPRLISDKLVDEVIVVGEYEAGDGYTYVSAPSVNFDCTDALHQRQAGFEASNGDIVVFLHDDHMPWKGFFELLDHSKDTPPEWDVLVPSRMCEREGRYVGLNNGAGDGYIMGHAVVMRRAAVEVVPWTAAEKVFQWDVSHTNLLRAAGQRIAWHPHMVVEDLEARMGSTPWR